jgi:hypothetical protein
MGVEDEGAGVSPAGIIDCGWTPDQTNSSGERDGPTGDTCVC